jgi:hypothetical protein
LNQVNDQDDDGNYEQEVDQTAANVADEAKKPEDDQDDNYRPKHGYSFWLSQTFVRLFIQRFIHSPSFSEHRVEQFLPPFRKASGLPDGRAIGYPRLTVAHMIL